MKSPVTGIVLLSLAAGLMRAAGPPLAAPDFRGELGSVAAGLTPAAPAASAGGLIGALATIEAVLAKS